MHHRVSFSSLEGTQDALIAGCNFNSSLSKEKDGLISLAQDHQNQHQLKVTIPKLYKWGYHTKKCSPKVKSVSQRWASSPMCECSTRRRCSLVGTLGELLKPGME